MQCLGHVMRGDKYEILRLIMEGKVQRKRSVGRLQGAYSWNEGSELSREISTECDKNPPLSASSVTFYQHFSWEFRFLLSKIGPLNSWLKDWGRWFDRSSAEILRAAVSRASIAIWIANLRQERAWQEEEEQSNHIQDDHQYSERIGLD